MTRERDLDRIRRIVSVGRDLAGCVERNGITRGLILIDQDIRWMVSMPVFDISEQVSRLSEAFLQERPIEGAYAIAGMRNRMAHGYADVGYEFIADAVFEDVPALVGRCKEILADLGLSAD